MKKKGKEPSFKPEVNQPAIKSVIKSTKTVTGQKIRSSVLKVQGEPNELNCKQVKKRHPPTPPERNTPAKCLNMSLTIENLQTSDEATTKDNNISTPVLINGTELSPELQKLRELLKSDMEEMMIKPLRDRMTTLEKSQELLEKKGELINAIKTENLQLWKDCDSIMKENNHLQGRLEKIENKLMGNNVILHGIKDQVWELSEVTREKALVAISSIANGKTAKEKLDVVRKIGFRDIRRLGEYKANRKCPIILEFEKKISADFLLQNKKQLPKGIFADREYSEEIENERRKLRPILCKAKELPEYKMKSKMEGANLIIKGRSYTSKTLHLLPEPLTGYNVSSKKSESHIGFFGELNPLSNFHAAPFIIEGIKFHSSEQWIQFQKAKLFQEETTSCKILESVTPHECKLLSKEISNFDPSYWSERASSLCEIGINAKFTQNPSLMKLLVSTGNKTLVECAYDRLWGNGVPLHDEHCLNEDNWTGDNLLGNILMQIRSKNADIIVNNKEQVMDT